MKLTSPTLCLLLLGFVQLEAVASETRSQYENFLLLVDRDKYTQALLLINKLIAESPKDDLYLSERARVNMNLNRLKEALADCNKAIAINPKNANALRTRSYCYLMLKNYQAGINDLDQVLKYTQPDPVNLWPRSDHENRARAYALIGRHDLARKERPLCMLDQLTEQAVLARDGASLKKAIQHLEQVLAQDPKHLNALGFKGLCHNNLTQFTQSIELLSRAIAQKPNCAPLLYLRADGYRETKQYDKAIADLTRVIGLKPRVVMFKQSTHTGRLRDKFNPADTDCVNLADIYFLRGSCYDSLKMHDLAVKDFSKTVELDPKEYKGAAALGNAYFNMRKFNEAIKAYSKALELNPRYWEVYTLRSRAYEQTGNVEKAAADLTTILSRNPNDAGAFLLRAHVYQRAKQYQKAIADFTKVTELAPSDDEGFRERADCYAKLGQYERALADYNKALSLSSEDKEAINKAKAEVIKKMGKPTK